MSAPKLVVWASDGASIPDLSGLGSRELVVATRDTLESAAADAEVILVADFLARDADPVWRRADSAQWVHVLSTGVDHVLTPSLIDSDVMVTNGRGCFDRSIAEFVLLQVLALAKDLPASQRAQQELTWQPRLCERLDGARVLVIGPGSIGGQIARLLGDVGMRVDGAGRRTRAGGNGFGRIHSTQNLIEYVGEYDYVVLAAALTHETRHLIDRQVLQAMSSTARLINVSRGAIVDEQALIAALADGSIAGAALDVFEVEPLPQSSPLWRMPNVIVTAHMAGDYTGWRDWQYELFAQNFARFTSGLPLQNVLDKSLGYVVS